MKVLEEDDRVIVSVAHAQVEVAEPGAAVAETEVEPEVLTKGKKDEDQEPS